MIYNVDDNIKTIKLDDIIRGVYTQGQYTHDELEDMLRHDFINTPYYKYTKHIKLFMVYILNNNEWIVQPIFMKGKAALIEYIKARDLSILKQNNTA